MLSLTDDEYTVLLIAAEGQSMISIGRWEKPIDNLVRQGLLSRGDKFNNFITPEGRAAIAARETEDNKVYVDILEHAGRVQNAQTQARLSVAEAVRHLVVAAKASAHATGDTPEEAPKQWALVATQSALEHLRAGN